MDNDRPANNFIYGKAIGEKNRQCLSVQAAEQGILANELAEIAIKKLLEGSLNNV